MTRKGDYILGSDRDVFAKAGVIEARHHTDHQMVLAVLRGEEERQNLRYVGDRIKWPLEAPMVKPQKEGDAAFASRKGGVERKERPKLVKAPWISKETWRLADRRAVLL